MSRESAGHGRSERPSSVTGATSGQRGRSGLSSVPPDLAKHPLEYASVEALHGRPDRGQWIAGEPGRCSAACSCADPATCPVLRSAEARERQQAGLAALVAIAAQVSLAMSEAATTVIPVPQTWQRETDVGRDASPRVPEFSPVGQDVTQGSTVRRGPLARLRSDHLVRNSLYLMLSSGIQAALGFAFWIIMARLFSTEDVGRASSLVSATSLIAYFALFGLNSTLVRYLPTAQNRNALVTSAFLLVACAGCLMGLVYILLTPALAPKLAFVAHRPVLTVGFAVLAAAAAVNLLTDSVFVASRKASFCALTDGAVGGLSKISLGLVLAGTGAYGLFCASVGGFAAAALVSVVLLLAALHWRPSFRKPLETLKPLLKFSGSNYAANALNLLPSVIVPIIVLDRIGAQSAAYYFVAFQMATLLYAAIYAVEQAFLAEGSQAGADWRAIRRRSRRLAITLFLPGAAALAVTSHWLLLAFGQRYSTHGTATLQLLAIAVVPMAACNWSWTVLRLSNRLGTLVVTSVAYSSGICCSAWILAPHGLTAMTSSWCIGSTLAAIIATLATALSSGNATARHRRTTRTALPEARPR